MNLAGGIKTETFSMKFKKKIPPIFCNKFCIYDSNIIQQKYNFSNKVC